ncbi:MAG TPA: hypothetical protein VHH73_02745 [Verrucomicrobiae bacterium]|nr:hypothetical protein [Verrucomicrobiae bacterium]
MKQRETKVNGRLDRAEREESPPFQAAVNIAFEQLKQRLLANLLAETPEAKFNGPLRRATNEAASLAWMAGYPQLTLPVLLSEKARLARRHAIRQERISASSRVILAKAA